MTGQFWSVGSPDHRPIDRLWLYSIDGVPSLPEARPPRMLKIEPPLVPIRIHGGFVKGEQKKIC